MFFIVTGNRAEGAIVRTCETPHEALAAAEAFADAGAHDLLIADRDGRQYPPAEFRLHFVGDGAGTMA